MNDKTIQLLGMTDVGCVRTGNEDCYIIQPMAGELGELNPPDLLELVKGQDFFAAVSDGMGGAVAGELASRTGLIGMSEFLHEKSGALVKAEPEATVNLLERGLHVANERILQKVQETQSLKGMGATMTAVYLKQDILYLLQVGDSRAYVLREKKFVRVTRDQSFVGHLVEMGTISEAQAMKHPRRNVILQAMGTQQELKVDVSFLPLCRDDLVLICSDGLYSEFLPDELAEQVRAVAAADDLKQGLTDLVQRAKDAGGKDNITVIAIKVNQAAPDREPGEEPKYRPFPYQGMDNPLEKTQSLFQ